MSQTTLESYLVKLDARIDTDSWSKFNRTIEGADKMLTGFLEGGAVGIPPVLIPGLSLPLARIVLGAFGSHPLRSNRAASVNSF